MSSSEELLLEELDEDEELDELLLLSSLLEDEELELEDEDEDEELLDESSLDEELDESSLFSPWTACKMEATVFGSSSTCTAPSVVWASELSEASEGVEAKAKGKAMLLSRGSHSAFSTTEPQMRQGRTPSISLADLTKGWGTSAKPLAMFREIKRFSALGDMSALPKMREVIRFQMWPSLASPLGTMTREVSPPLETAIKSTEAYPSFNRSAAPSRTSGESDLFVTISLSKTSVATSKTSICSTSAISLGA
jgi:hypothetical protein